MAVAKQISIDDAYRQGMTHFQNGQLKPAATLFSKIVRVLPDHALSHQMLGLIGFQLGQYDPAIKAMTEAVRLQPDNVGFLTNFTEILRMAGRPEQAVETGLRAVHLAPGHAAAHSNLGLAFYDLDKLAEAAASQRRALALDPGFDRAVNNLGSIARDNGEPEKAARYYREALQLNPASAETANNLISILIELEELKDALAVAGKQLKRAPRDAELHRGFGRIFLLQSELDKAESAFRNAISLNAQKADSYVGLSQVLYEKNHPKLALVEVEHALRLAPEDAAACHQAGLIKAQLGDEDAAISCLHRALELKPDGAASLLALGNLELERGNFSVARSFYERAAAISGDKMGALIALARLDKATPESPVFLALEAELPNVEQMLPQKAAAYHYAMGESLEQLTRYEEAFVQFEKGASLKRSMLSYDPTENDRLTDELITTFDTGMIERLRDCAVFSERPIFVVGMPRSGTTLTEAILNAHPEVFGAGELNDLQNLFGSVGGRQTSVPVAIRSLADGKLTVRAEEYLKTLTRHAPQSPRIVDKMPANFQLIGLIHGILPNAKIIHIARDPFDTCLSCYTRLFERSQLHSYDLVELGRFYNNYVRLMNHWRELLPAAAFHSLHYEALIDDFGTEARRIVDYCGLDWDDACLEFFKSKRRVRTASVQQVRQPLYASSKAKWRKYERQLHPLIETIGENRIEF